MKITKSIFLIASTLLFICCSTDDSIVSDTPDEEAENNEEPETTIERFFTLNTDSNYDTSETDDWIIISTNEGFILDFKAFEAGDSFEFETDTSNLAQNLSITFFSASTVSLGIFYSLNTFPLIENGSIWNLKSFEFVNSNEMRGENLGELEITVDNIPELFSSEISNKYGLLGGSSSSSTINGLTSITSSYSQFENVNENMITIVDGNRELKYMFFENTGPNQFFDYNQFFDFNTTIEVSVPNNIESYFSIVFAFEDEQEFSIGGGFQMHKIFPFEFADFNQNPVKIGYLDRFNKYSSEVKVDYNDKISYNFEKYGTQPNEILIPEIQNLTIIDESIQSFNFSTNLEFKRRLSRWNTSSGVLNENFISTTWTMNAQDNTHEIPIVLPEEISNAYPEMNVNSLEYSETTLFLQFDSYQEFIDKKYVLPEINPVFFSVESLRFSK